MKYGYFDDQNKEYIITNPKTPVKWINYIGTLAFGGFVDHTGGSLICKGDPALNRITKYISQLPSSEFKGECLYLRFKLPRSSPRLGGGSGAPGTGLGAKENSYSIKLPRSSSRLGGAADAPGFCPEPATSSVESAQPEGTGLRAKENSYGIKPGEGYKVFSPYFVPTLDEYDLYECHVGLGYSRFVSEYYGLRTDVAIFVPLGDSRVIRDYKITNVSDRPVEVDAVPVVEYTHFDALRQLTNADWVPQTMQSRVHRNGDGTIILTQFAFMRQGSAINYFTSNQAVGSFESVRARFLGENEYGTWANPQSLQGVELGNDEAHRGDNVGALLHHLGKLEPGETKRLITQLGQEESVEKALPLVQKYRDEKQVDAALEQVKRFWDEYLSKVRVKTPNADVDRMLNIHNPRQCHVTQNWSRYLSLYQLGLGARGIGFRDTSQDVMGIMAHTPRQGRELIEKLLHVQRRNGSAMHQFNPLSMIANEGDSRESEEGPDYYGDDHLWIVLAIGAYLKETGDLAFLDAVIPYYEKDEKEKPIETGTVLDHMQRAIEFTRNNVGAHGLPLLGFADWNDAVNLPAGAESFFVANLYGKALLEMMDLARHRDDGQSLARYSGYYDEMKARVNEYGWDGDWYVRYFDAGGNPLGSKDNIKGQIYTNGQSWPVLSGFAPPERARAALESVYARLNTRNGIKLSMPGYNGFDPGKGGITTYPPGAKENGGIFLHANPWVIIAETIAGNGERAFEYYNQVNPAAKNDRIDEFECEPYVYPQNILSDEHPQFGLARNSWLTGTASWMYQAGTQYILGIRPTYDGLRIDPCIPAGWGGFKVTREFRGATYQIEVVNPDHVNKGIKSIHVNGQEIEGNVVPILAGGQAHQIQVIMG